MTVILWTDAHHPFRLDERSDVTKSPRFLPREKKRELQGDSQDHLANSPRTDSSSCQPDAIWNIDQGE